MHFHQVAMHLHPVAASAALANQQQQNQQRHYHYQQQQHFFSTLPLPNGRPTNVPPSIKPAEATSFVDDGHGATVAPNLIRLATFIPTPVPVTVAQSAAAHAAFIEPPNFLVHLRSPATDGLTTAGLCNQSSMANNLPPTIPALPPNNTAPFVAQSQTEHAALHCHKSHGPATPSFLPTQSIPPHPPVIFPALAMTTTKAPLAAAMPSHSQTAVPFVTPTTGTICPLPAATIAALAVPGRETIRPPPPQHSGHHTITKNERMLCGGIGGGAGGDGKLPPQGVPQHGANTNNNIRNGNTTGDCWSTAVTGWEQAAIIKNKIGLLINGRFRILQSIASGSYGEIFAAEDLQQRRHRMAVKFDGACRDNHLRYEYQVYKSALYEDGNGKVDGFPQVYWYGHEYGHNILVMELLGAPVASLFAFCDRKFAKQTIVSLGEQMIHRIRHLHQRGFIHRDIKPENFLMGLHGKESTLYLIDFGLARRYRYRENRALTHIPFRRGRSFIGTAKYASLNSHKNIELSRRDDVESLAYVLIELVNGHLPWKNISKRNATTRHQASLRIRTLKEQTNWEEFCPSMAKFIRYCREISFNEEPDYDRLLDLLQLITVIPPAEVTNDVKKVGATVVPLSSTLPTRSRAAPIIPTGGSPLCCQQMPATAEKMTQVDFDSTKINEHGEEDQEDEQQMKTNSKEKIERPISSSRMVSSTIRRLSSLKVVTSTSAKTLANNCGTIGSDADEMGAATTTTTTSCSENELLVLDSCGVGDRLEESSATGENCSFGPAVSDGDDELTADSQPVLQQQDQPPPVCRKCRRLRDQQNQHKRSQLQQQTTKQQGITVSPMKMEMHHQHQPLQKMCWQQARDSNPERRFQYENRFSWTVDKQQQQQQAVVAVQMHQQQAQDQFPFYKLRAGAALPICGPQMQPHHQQQQHLVSPPQFILQHHQPAFCTNVPPAHSVNIAIPNSATAAVPPFPPPPPLAVETVAQGIVAPQQRHQYNNNVQLPGADLVAAKQQQHNHQHYMFLSAAPAHTVVSPADTKFGSNLISCIVQKQQQQQQPLSSSLSFPPQPPVPMTAQQQEQCLQQQKRKRFMHIAFVLPPPTSGEDCCVVKNGASVAATKTTTELQQQDGR